MPRLFIPIVLTASLCLIGFNQRASAQEWANYKNERFGYSVLYPGNFLRPDNAPAQDDGLRFLSADGQVKLKVFGAFNNENMGIGEYRTTILKNFSGYDKVTYGPMGSTWFVLSGLRGGNVYYQKVLFSCGGRIVNVFSITYPADEKALYDPIVTQIERNFHTAAGSGCFSVMGASAKRQ